MNPEVEKFIHDHTHQYGLMGTNITHNPPKYPELENMHSAYEPTRDNWFHYGYNGKFFGNRRSSTCMYFTEYRQANYEGSLLPLREELVVAARSVHDRYGPVTVINRGRAVDYAVVQAFADAKVTFFQKVICFDGEPTKYPFVGHASGIDIYEQDMIDAAGVLVPWIRTRSAANVLDMALASRISGQCLVFAGGLHLINHHHDGLDPCGPPNWALDDSEEDTALMRYGMFCEDPICMVPDFTRWSPQLVASQIGEVLPWVLGPGLNENNAYEATRKMWLDVSPFPEQAYPMPDWWDSIQGWVDEVHDKGKCNEKWHTPLPRLLERLNIPAHEELSNVRTYGEVFAPPTVHRGDA